jgi:hypothetical protein
MELDATTRCCPVERLTQITRLVVVPARMLCHLLDYDDNQSETSHVGKEKIALPITSAKSDVLRVCPIHFHSNLHC